jgi:hypothetical protein
MACALFWDSRIPAWVSLLPPNAVWQIRIRQEQKILHERRSNEFEETDQERKGGEFRFRRAVWRELIYFVNAGDLNST